MYSPPPYWSLTYGPSSGIIDPSYSPNNSSHGKSRARSVGRLNSTSSSNSGSSNSNKSSNMIVHNTPTSPNFSDSFCSSSTITEGGALLSPPVGIGNTSLCQQLSEEQFDIIENLDYDDVDDMGLIDRELSHRNRESLVQQLYNAEQDYLESLNQLVTLFMQPLRKDAQQPSSNFIGMKKIICTEHEIQRLFGNIEELYDTQREILLSLDSRLRMWGPTQIISDIFQGWFKMLFDVYIPYLNNYDNAVTQYERLRSYQPFRKFTDGLQKDPSLKGTTLYSLLQLPVRSIHRLVQRISELADTTPPLHPDYVGLKMCRQRAIRLLEDIQAMVEDAENVDRVVEIQRSMTGSPLTIKKGRRIILEAELSRTHSQSRVVGEKRVYFLFSEFLAFARPRRQQQHDVLHVQYQYKGHLNLERARVKRVAPEDASGREFCIGITPLYQGAELLDTTLMSQYAATHVIQLNNAQEQKLWLEKLNQVIHKLNAKADRKSTASGSSNTRNSSSSRKRKQTNGVQWSVVPYAY
ncbi:Dbl homology domain-containing protein [Phascolomyces articulosus]|uniref:Dbl homology domain-containing protein n=1 Tax=Phascolomyces articulosus TaxID=60185 RepID=A0AAD5PJX5_9FUNG|nr:Dbl homology domain-containing protein [Phascolomyces articulosus]